MNGCKISPVALGLSLGIIWGLSILGMGLMAYYYSYGRPFVDAVATLYQGYEPSVQGSLLGGAIAFLDAFIMGVLVAWLYNRFSSCKCCSTSCTTSTIDSTPVSHTTKVKTERKPRAVKSDS